MDRTAGIVIIGDEILTGKFADENAKFLIGALRDLGVALRRIAVIPDDKDDIATTVRSFSERFDLVFTSGGVGPTHDDVTIAAIAEAFDVKVVVEPTLLELLKKFYGDKLGPGHLRLAETPDGAEMIYGTDKVWPTTAFRNIYILPGVPSLFRRKFVSICSRWRTEPYLVGRVYLSADETTIAAELTQIVAAHPKVQFGSYPRWHETEFKVILTIESKDSSAADAAFEALTNALEAHVVRSERPALAKPADDSN